MTLQNICTGIEEKVRMAKLKRKKDPFPEYPFECDFCHRLIENQDFYIKHLKFHVRNYALKLQLIID